MQGIFVELQNVYGTSRDVATAAWTSSYDYGKKLDRTEDDVKRVVNMLADSKHSVPFESIIFRFWFKIPITVDRQLMTHRIASHSGMSGRYRTMPNEWQTVPNDVAEIIKKFPRAYTSGFGYIYDSTCRLANKEYNMIVDSLKDAEKSGNISNKELKRAREFFRGMLPQANLTERVTVINLRSFANFYSLRSKPDAMPEIQYLAKSMLEEVKKHNQIAIAIEALERNEWDI